MTKPEKNTIIIINGSPRKNGTISRLLHSAADNISRSHTDIHWYNVNDMHIQPCTGCMKCRSTGRCILSEDDAHKLAEDLSKCSGIILGSPVYWGNISGQMKLVLDRLVAVLMGESKTGIPVPKHKGKPAVIVTACTTPWPFSFLCGETTHAIRAMKEILCYSGFKITGTLAVSGTKNRDAVSPGIMSHGKLLADKFNRVL